MVELTQIVAVALAFVTGMTEATNTNKPPLILVPGLLGTQLEAKFKRRLLPPSCCGASLSRGYTPFQRVLNGTFESYVTPCWFDTVSLEYDETSDQFKEKPWIKKSKPTGPFGSLENIMYQDPDNKERQAWAFVVPALNGALGYATDGSDGLVAAPYDFRFAPDVTNRQHPANTWFRKTKKMIKQQVKATGKKAVLYTHSLGCNYMLHFLQAQKPRWRKKYIASWMGVGCPWAGVPDLGKAYASGEDQDAEANEPLVAAFLRKYQISMEILPYLAPNPKLDVWKDTLMFTDVAKGTSYNVTDLEKFVKDSLREGEPAYDQALERIQELHKKAIEAGPPCDVKSVFLSRTGLNTSYRYEYNDGLQGSATEIRDEVGDGRVTDESKMVCDNWAEANSNVECSDMGSEPVSQFGIVFAHDAMIADPIAIRQLASLVATAPEF